MCNLSRRVAIFGNCHQAEKSDHTEAVVRLLREAGMQVAMEREFLNFLREQTVHGRFFQTVDGFDTAECAADLAFSMGGDGTFLTVAEKVRDRRIPILGINTGHLGFLAEVTTSGLETAIARVVRGEYEVQERSLIAIEDEDKELTLYPFALNEVALLKYDNSSLIEVETRVEGALLANYLADGLIICTPTGSTAYSLSVGGPVLEPQSATICLSPIAPHSLTVRPVVLRDDVTVEVHVRSRSGRFLLSVDGRSETLSADRVLRIHKAHYTLPVVSIPPHHFFSTLREKMMWGKDRRH